ncbi:MAG: nucleoside-diphosphate sugar epimerase/dehydratase [Clostridiales bacterium]
MGVFHLISKWRNYIVLFTDIFLVACVYLTVIGLLDLRAGVYILHIFTSTSLLVLIYLLSFLIFKIYRSLWRFAEIREFALCINVSLASGILYCVLHRFFIKSIPFSDNLLAILLISLALVSYRFLYRVYRRRFVSYLSKDECEIIDKTRTLIVGAGDATAMLLTEIKKSSNSPIFPVAIVDDDAEKQGKQVRNITVVGRIEDISTVCKQYDVEEINICIPSASDELRRKILNYCAQTACTTKIMPESLSNMIHPVGFYKQMRSVSLEDFLNRDVNMEKSVESQKFIEGRVVLITGGGGSIGSELCRQIIALKPKLMIILDNYENNAYDLEQELLRNGIKRTNMVLEIASVCDKRKMDFLFDKYRPNYVFHAAAHKHVPLMEHNPEEAVKNNIFGTFNVANLAEKYKVERFVLISTDKAVHPSSFMGATKRICEMIVQSKNGGSTEFVAVRFGNVLGSNGSVIPLFERQIQAGGPVTVTHKDMKRYFMTIPEAVNLVLQAGSMAKGGEIFVLNMGEPVKILDLAENLIKNKGYRPYKDIKIEFTGLRPGEKLYEELLLDEEDVHSTENKRIYCANQMKISRRDIDAMLHRFDLAISTKDQDLIFYEMGRSIPSFKQNHYIVKPEVKAETVDEKIAKNDVADEENEDLLLPVSSTVILKQA